MPRAAPPSKTRAPSLRLTPLAGAGARLCPLCRWGNHSTQRLDEKICSTRAHFNTEQGIHLNSRHAHLTHAVNATTVYMKCAEKSNLKNTEKSEKKAKHLLCEKENAIFLWKSVSHKSLANSFKLTVWKTLKNLSSKSKKNFIQIYKHEYIRGRQYSKPPII